MKIGDKDHENETFTNFAARFRNKVVLRKESLGDQSYRLQEKITNQLREDTKAIKHTQANDFQTIVTSLTSTNLKTRRNYERTKQHVTTRNTPKSTIGNAGTTYKLTQKSVRPLAVPGLSTALKVILNRPKFSTSPIPPLIKKLVPNDACFLYGQVSYFKA